MKIIKKVRSSTLACLACLPLSVYGHEYYVGAQVGWMHQKIDIDNSIRNGFGVPNDNDVNFDKNLNSFIGGIHLGYKYLVNEKFFVGLEAEINYTNKSTVRRTPLNTLDINETSFETKHSIIPKLLLGTRLHERTDIFLVLGMDISQFKVRLSNVEDGKIVASNQQIFHDVRFMPGLGVNYKLTDKLSTKLEGRYHAKSSGKTIAFRDGGEDYKTRFKQDAVSVILGLSYNL